MAILQQLIYSKSHSPPVHSTEDTILLYEITRTVPRPSNRQLAIDEFALTSRGLSSPSRHEILIQAVTSTLQAASGSPKVPGSKTSTRITTTLLQDLHLRPTLLFMSSILRCRHHHDGKNKTRNVATEKEYDSSHSWRKKPLF